MTDDDSLLRAIVGALRAAINDHAPITPEHIGSAAKRILGNLVNEGEKTSILEGQAGVALLAGVVIHGARVQALEVGFEDVTPSRPVLSEVVPVLSPTVEVEPLRTRPKRSEGGFIERGPSHPVSQKITAWEYHKGGWVDGRVVEVLRRVEHGVPVERRKTHLRIADVCWLPAGITDLNREIGALVWFEVAGLHRAGRYPGALFQPDILLRELQRRNSSGGRALRGLGCTLGNLDARSKRGKLVNGNAGIDSGGDSGNNDRRGYQFLAFWKSQPDEGSHRFLRSWWHAGIGMLLLTLAAWCFAAGCFRILRSWRVDLVSIALLILFAVLVHAALSVAFRLSSNSIVGVPY